jgi:hypothetical protein
MCITKPGRCFSVLAALTFLSLPALAEPRSPRLNRVHRLYYGDLVPKGTAFSAGSSRYALKFKQQDRRGDWQEQWSSPRYAETESRAPFRLQGTILAHDGRSCSSVLTDGRRVTPHKAVQVKIEGRVPRKGSKKRTTDLPWITVLPLHTDLPAIRRLAHRKGWGDFQLDIGAVNLRYSKDGGKTWKQRTQSRPGDIELQDVSPHDRILYEAKVPLRASSQGGRRFEGKEVVVFSGAL